MAETATADNVSEQELDLSNLISDLTDRLSAQDPMREAKGDYDALCKGQNEAAGYNKKAMNILTALQKMSAEKFQDVMRTLQPGLELLADDRGNGDTPDFLDDTNLRVIE